MNSEHQPALAIIGSDYPPIAVDEAMRITSLSESQLRKQVKPFWKLGGRKGLRWRYEDLVAFVNASRIREGVPLPQPAAFVPLDHRKFKKAI
jgi:hypothetical protein